MLCTVAMDAIGNTTLQLAMDAEGNTTLTDDNATYYYGDYEYGFYYYENGDAQFDGFYLDSFATMNTVYAYVLLSISIIGVLGNIVTIVVFQRGRRCGNSWCAFLFTALAAADLYVLLFSAFPNSLDALGLTDAMYENAALCTFNQFNYDFCIQISTWMTVTITVDRAITVMFPLKCRNMATRKWMCIKIGVVCLVSAAVNLPVVFQLDYTEFQCSVDREGSLYIIYFLINEGVLLCLLPAVINVVCNVIILRALFRRAANASEMGLTESQATSRRSDANAVMYRVIAIGVVHLLSTFPMMTYLVLFAMRNNVGKDSEPPVSQSTELIWNYLGAAAFYLNSGVNCVFYGMVGSDFRQDLKTILCILPARRTRVVSTSGGATESTGI